LLIIGGLDIGNRLDIGQRMIEAIKKSDLVLVESYSHFSKLCQDLSISPSGEVIEYYAPMPENEEQNVIRLAFSYLENDRSVLICPDDGMAGIADPGGRLVAIAHDKKIPVEVIPGPSIISALPAALGMGGKSFIFDDDIPGPDKLGRVKKLEWIKESKSPYLFLVKNRRDDNSKLADIFNDIEIVFGKEYPVGIGVNVSMTNQVILRGPVSFLKSKIASLGINQSHFVSILVEGKYE